MTREHPSLDEFVAARGTRSCVSPFRADRRDLHQAEDLVQNALAKIMGRWDRICLGGHPEAYLRRVVVTGVSVVPPAAVVDGGHHLGGTGSRRRRSTASLLRCAGRGVAADRLIPAEAAAMRCSRCATSRTGRSNRSLQRANAAPGQSARRPRAPWRTTFGMQLGRQSGPSAVRDVEDGALHPRRTHSGGPFRQRAGGSGTGERRSSSLVRALVGVGVAPRLAMAAVSVSPPRSAVITPIVGDLATDHADPPSCHGLSSPPPAGPASPGQTVGRSAVHCRPTHAQLLTVAGRCRIQQPRRSPDQIAATAALRDGSAYGVVAASCRTARTPLLDPAVSRPSPSSTRPADRSTSRSGPTRATSGENVRPDLAFCGGRRALGFAWTGSWCGRRRPRSCHTGCASPSASRTPEPHLHRL